VFAFSPTLNPLDILAGRFLEVPVPKLTGLTQDRALVELERSRLEGDVSFVYSSDVERGKVVRQKPSSGSTLRRGSAAAVFVSRGPEYIPVPDIAGKTRGTAIAALKKAGLKVSEERLNDEEVKAGDVISQKPAAGTVVEGGSTVAIKVSTGPVTRTVPEVAGMPVDGAAFNLGKAGFQLGTLTLADNPLVRKGGVVGTDPPAKSVLPRDTPVNLVISSGPPPVAVPNVTGGSRGAASAALTNLGFLIGEVPQTGAIGDPRDGTVMGQTPAAGTQLRPGDVVTITVLRAAQPPPTLPPTTLPPPTTAPVTAPPGG
jgi:serine/threonine-protein kinase